MEIKVGKFTIRSDKFSMWLEEEYESQDDKTKGKLMTKQVAGYCTSFDRLLEDFIDKKIKDSEVASVEEALKVLADATADAKKIAKSAYKGDFKIIRNKEK